MPSTASGNTQPAQPLSAAVRDNGAHQSLFQKLFKGIGTAQPEAAPSGASPDPRREQLNPFKQALNSVANSWRAVITTTPQEDDAGENPNAMPWTRAGSPFVRIALCGEAQSGRTSLANHAEARLRKMSQRAAPFIEKRVPASEKAGGTSYTYEVRLQGARRQLYSSLVTVTDTGPSPLGTCGTSQRELQLSDAILLVYPLTGIKQRERCNTSSSGGGGGGGARKYISPDTVLVSPQSEALLTRLLSAAVASRYDSSVRVYVVATFMDCLSDASVPAVRAVLLRLRALAQSLFPHLVLTHLFAVSLKDQTCVSEVPLEKADDHVEVSDMWTTLLRAMCTTALRSASLSLTVTSTSSTDRSPFVWRPVPYSVILGRLQEECCAVEPAIALAAEPVPLVYLRELEAKMSVSSQRALMFIEQSQAREDVVFLSVESLWKRFFALGVASHAQFVQLLHYLEGRGQVVVFANRTLRRGQLPRHRPGERPHRPGCGAHPVTAANFHMDNGSSHLSDCVCMHPYLLRQAEAAVLWYHRLVTTHERQLESVLYGVDTAACRSADDANGVAKGFFSPAVLKPLSEYLVLPSHFRASATQRLQIFVSLLCFADVGCVVRDRGVSGNAGSHRLVSPRTRTPPPAAESSFSDAAVSRSTTAGVFCSPDSRGPHIVEVEALMPLHTPREHLPETATTAENDSCLAPFARVTSTATGDTHETVRSNAASETSSVGRHSALSDPGGPLADGAERPPPQRPRRWRLLVPSLLIPFYCPTHLLQTAAALCAVCRAAPRDPPVDATMTMTSSALFYRLHPRPPPSFFVAMTCRLSSWCVAPFMMNALWLWPRKPVLRGTSSAGDRRLSALPQVRLLVALVQHPTEPTTPTGVHLEMYGFADDGAELSLAVTQQEAVVEIESLLHQKYPHVRALREANSWLSTSEEARRQALSCSVTADLDTLFDCSE